MARAVRHPLWWVVDSREQTPVRLGEPVRREFTLGGSVVQGLSEGDYAVSLDTGETILPIRIERKSHIDLLGCVGHGRERFERELVRLEAYQYRAIVIEASLDDILRGHERSQVTGRAAASSLAGWSVRYGVHIWFAENHRRAGAIIQRLLEEFAVNHLRKKE